MPTKRRIAKHRDNNPITPEAIEAYRNGDYGALQRALRLKPWETSPLWVQSGDPPVGTSAFEETYPKAQALRAELEAAMQQSGEHK